ncbi:tRNA pseudouridine(13) synthase TruD [Candidatus Micrarchaeota archaeon]|nr:tRNA pseudouridine(13) synthase TruD [Candidatus Micrarchaeota archaeon]
MFDFEPEEFIVEEIMQDGTILELDKKIEVPNEQLIKENQYFSRFVLQKRLWTTNNAIKRISDQLHISANRINFAGNKDRNAISTQLCSAFAIPKEKLLALKLKDIQINGAWIANEKVKLGNLQGNRFTILLNDENIGKEQFERLSAGSIISSLEKNNFAIPNYFGDQRFGSARKNTAQVGKLILQGKFEEAVMNYLCFTDETERDEQARGARQRLEKEKDFSKAMHYFPNFLRIEKRMLEHLSKFPNDYLGAYRKLHRPLQLLFIHAFQSLMFNKLLEKKIENGDLQKAKLGDHYSLLKNGFPDEEILKIETEKQLVVAQNLINSRQAVICANLIGYESILAKEETAILISEGILQEQFKLPSVPELGSKGDFRPICVYLSDFECSDSQVDEKKSIRLRFSLPSGSYATVAIQNLLKT